MGSTWSQGRYHQPQNPETRHPDTIALPQLQANDTPSHTKLYAKTHQEKRKSSLRSRFSVAQIGPFSMFGRGLGKEGIWEPLFTQKKTLTL